MGAVVAAELTTPWDEASGLPLPLMPRDDLPLVPIGRQRNLDRVADWHHHFHPRAAFAGEDLGLVAVRHCRVQWTEYDEHHHQYHGAYAGPLLPETVSERFQTVVLAVAGYIPSAGIYFQRGTAPVVRELDDAQRYQLWESGQMRVENPAIMRNFMLDYALRHDFSGINDITIDEFLSTKDEQRKRELGGTLLAIAAYDAAGPIQSLYKQSRELHLLPPERARTAGRFVFGVMNTHRRSRALAALTHKLAAAA